MQTLQRRLQKAAHVEKAICRNAFYRDAAMHGSWVMQTQPSVGGSARVASGIQVLKDLPSGGVLLSGLEVFKDVQPISLGKLGGTCSKYAERRIQEGLSKALVFKVNDEIIFEKLWQFDLVV